MSSKRKVCVLGSTGTIGTYTLELIRAFPEQFEAVSLAAGKNLTKLQEQIRLFKPQVVSVQDEAAAHFLRQEFPKLQVGSGIEGIKKCIEASEVDVVIVGIVGFAGLEPTLHAIQHGKLIGLANKESLVTAGSLFNEAVRKSSAKIVPVDSEHNALYQLLNGVEISEVQTVVLTASGGPFLKQPDLDLKSVTPEMAISHPNWKMGPKISVDSASLMNKGLELIEAHFLFGFPENQIEVWVHPQSIVHGAIWLKDNTNLAQLSLPDMKSAIGYALSYPGRLLQPIKKLTLDQMSRLEFFEPDLHRFPCLGLARKALRAGQSHIVALNAANEIAVEAFLNRRIGFTQIPEMIDATLQEFPGMPIHQLSEVFEADRVGRQVAKTAINRI
ncbi:MAG: 1-deoxy-D-xylulose-5-phosphate reductoisomerase [Proteobacteria bacterium]|nr:1-deoxy-D-xylulose-5-phosphate reductoisomerase [Pseudomonadota bacterium]